MQKTVSVLCKTLIRESEVSLAVLDTTALVNEAITRHALSPVAAAALGRTLTASAYLCGWLKEEESALSVSVDGGGVGGKIFVSGDGALNLRGFVQNPSVALPPRADGKLDVGRFVGREGTLTVTRDDGEGLPFSGSCPLVSGDIAEDFSAYFLQSEQRPTAVALGVKIGRDGKCAGAGGLFLQPLPFAKEENIDFCASEIRKYAALSSLIEEEGADGILRAFGAENVQVREIRYRCRCSRERAESLVRAMGREEAESLIKERGRVTVHCDYCNTDYDFDEERLLELFEGGERA